MNDEAVVSLYSRRKVLTGAAGCAAACVLSSAPVRGQDPLTVGAVVQIAQFAIGAAKLFQGSSPIDINDVIVRMLSNISAQLLAMQKNMADIAINISEVRRRIDLIPDEVVDALSTANLQGAVIVYEELLRTRARYGQDQKRFLAERKTEIGLLINRIRANRSVLISKNSYLNIPILATALYIEYGCMRLINDTDERLVAMAETYREYFKKAVMPGSPLTLSLSAEREKRHSLFTAFDKPQFEAMRVHDWGHGYWYTNVGYSVVSAARQPLANWSLRELTHLGLIEDIEHPIYLQSSFDMRSIEKSPRIVAEWAGPPVAYPYGSGQVITAFPMRSDRYNQIEADRSARQEEYNLVIDRIYSLVSCLHAGNRALNFTMQFA